MTTQHLRDGQPLSYMRFRWIVLMLHLVLMVAVMGSVAWLFAHNGQGMSLVEAYLDLALRASRG